MLLGRKKGICRGSFLASFNSPLNGQGSRSEWLSPVSSCALEGGRSGTCRAGYVPCWMLGGARALLGSSRDRHDRFRRCFFFSFSQPHFIIWANTPCLSFQPGVAQRLLARIESPVGWSLGRMGPCVARGTHVGCLASCRCPDELDQAHGKSIISQQLLDQGAFCLWGASLVKPERQEAR